MVLGWAEYDDHGAGSVQPATSSWERVQATQRSPRMPCLLVPQPAHAVLAGDLAEALLPQCFGELPEPIEQAIRMHDTGWAKSDAQQIQRLRAGSAPSSKAAPQSFIAIAASEAVEAWTASIAAVEALSEVGGMIVSRHFTLLAQGDPNAYGQFVGAEKSRQQRLGRTLALAEEDLERWTAALGFCDLVSLYLLTGLRGGADFALVHPDSAHASSAQTRPRVTLRQEQGRLRFTPSVFHIGSVLELQGLRHPAPAQGPRAETLRWEIVA